jgi:hypothetical protein
MKVINWGHSMWVTLHTISFNAPDVCTVEEKKVYNNFFKNLSELLPCKYCRTSFKLFLKFLPIEEYSNDRAGITYWLYTIHNLVNLKLNKNSNISFLDVAKYYESLRVVPRIDIDKFVSKTIDTYGNSTKTKVSKLLLFLKNNNWKFE